MEIEEFRALKEGTELGTPQAPEMGAQPETPPVKVEGPPQVPEGEQLPISEQDPVIPPLPPEKTPEQRAQEGEAEYRRKLQQSEARENLLRQQMNFTQQQLLALQQQNKPQPQVLQQPEMPEFEDPRDLAKWLDQKYERKFEEKTAAIEDKFTQKALKTEREQAAGRIMGSYQDMNNSSSLLHQQFTADCLQRGINPQTADPFTLEAVAAMAAAKCGILPQNIQQTTPSRQPLQTARPQIPGIQKMAPPASPQPVYNLSSQQDRWADTLSIPREKVIAFMQKNADKYVKADGTPLYGRRK